MVASRNGQKVVLTSEVSESTVRALADAAGIELDDKMVAAITPAFRSVLLSLRKLDELDLGESELPLEFTP